MAEIEDELPQRDDRSQSGRFLFENNGVGYCDDGIDGLLEYVIFDQGEFSKLNYVGEGKWKHTHEFATSRVFERLTSTALDAGNATVQLYRRFRLALNFGSCPENGLTVYTRMADHTAGVLHLYVYQAGAQILDAVVTPSGDATWELFTVTLPTATLARGNFLTLIFSLETTSVDVEADFGDYSLEYMTKRGNV